MEMKSSTVERRRACRREARRLLRGLLAGLVCVALWCLPSGNSSVGQAARADSDSSGKAKKSEQSPHWLLSPTDWNHGLAVSSLAVNAPSQVIAAGGWYGVVSLFNGATGVRTSLSVTGPSGEANWNLGEMVGLTFSGSGNRLAFAVGDVCYVIDMRDRTRVTRLVGHSRPVMSVLLDHEGKTAVTTSLDSTIRVWNIESKQEVARLAQHEDGVLSLCDVDGGKAFASSGYDGKIHKWSWTDWKLLGTLASAGSEVGQLAASLDGSMVAFSKASDTRTVYVVTVATAKLRQTIRFDRALSSFCFNGAGDAIVSSTNYQVELERNAELATTAISDGSTTTLEASLPGGASRMRSFGDQVVCAGADGALRLIDVRTRMVSGFKGSANAWANGVVFVGDSRVLVGTNAGFCNSVAITSQPGKDLAPEVVRTTIASPLFDAVIIDGRVLAVCGSGSGSARLWEERNDSAIELAAFGDGIVDRACFVEGGRGVVTSSRNGQVHHWRLRPKGDGALAVEHAKRLPQVHERVGEDWQLKLACGKLRDKDIIITGGLDAKVAVRWLDTHEIVCEFVVKSPTLSPNLDRVDVLAYDGTTGEVMAVCDGAVYLANVTGEAPKVRRLDLPEERYVGSVSWNPEGSKIYLGLISGGIVEWDIGAGTEARRLDAHRLSIVSLAVSDDGKWLASTGADGSLIVWPLQSAPDK